MTQQQQWLPDQQWWSIQQERVRHDQALYRIGEYAVFVLMWTINDFEAGLVGRCAACYTSFGVIADTYKQPSNDKCLTCFGTSFEGGYKAILVRPSLWTWSEATVEQDKRGEIQKSQGSVEATTDFRCEPKDYVFRGDGSRFKIQAVEGVHLDTGFGLQSHTSSAVSYTYQVIRVNPSDPGYLIPPTETVVLRRLGINYSRYPSDFHDLEVIRGPITF